MLRIEENDALLVVDVQNDFVKGGALAVPEGELIVPIVNQIQSKFSNIIATQDFHPVDHGSFASNHVGKKVGEFIELDGLTQILWPNHCVQSSPGADFHPDIDRSNWKAIFQKGKNPKVDSYSGFFDNARKGDTGLSDYLRSLGIERVFVCGLALDYCVKFTALDAKEQGFETFLIADATRAVNLNPQDGAQAIAEMRGQGIHIISSKDL